LNPNFPAFKKELSTPFAFSLFQLSQLPTAFFCGLRLKELSEEHATITVRYKWFNRNPFRSMYFAVMQMAGEVSTGILAMSALHKRNPSVSMLLVRNEGSYFKKAVGKISFTCNDGKMINEAVEKVVTTGAATTCACTSTGINEQGEVVAAFVFTWSFKARTSK
jgi:hypothetical protein